MTIFKKLPVTLLVAFSFSVSLCFAQAAPQTSAPANGQQASGFSLSTEEMMLLVALLQSPLFQDNFVQSCAAQSVEWLGTAQADKSCRCAFDLVTKNPDLISKIAGAVSADGAGVNFEKLGFDMVEPCLPKEFPPEADKAFVKECLKQSDVDKGTCECVLQSIKKNYTVRSLMKTAFDNRKMLETDITLKTAQCLSK
jgi:hypothetical protein